MGMYVQVITKGKPPGDFIRNVREEIHPKFQSFLRELAELCAEKMRQILLASGYDLQRLASAIKVDEISTTGGVHLGIGKISDLPVGQESGASYWEAFNEGFKVTTANAGYFTSGSGMSGDKTPPESGMSGQKWVHTGKAQGSFFMQPNKVISPLNYIGISSKELRKGIIQQLIKLNKTIENASK